jgi:hypothetical protein
MLNQATMLLDEGTANTTQPIIAQECRQWKGRLRRSTRTRSVPRVSEFVLTGNPETIFWLCTKCRVTGKLTIPSNLVGFTKESFNAALGHYQVTLLLQPWKIEGYWAFLILPVSITVCSAKPKLLVTGAQDEVDRAHAIVGNEIGCLSRI